MFIKKKKKNFDGLTQSKQGLKRPVSKEEGLGNLPKLYAKISMTMNMCIFLRRRYITFIKASKESMVHKG